MRSNEPLFCPEDLISSYTRRQAIEDGVLVDLSVHEITRSHWKILVACTASVFAVIEAAVGQRGQDLPGILHDIFSLAKLAMRRAREGERLVRFTVLVNRRAVQLKLHIGPGDTPAPVLTIMLPNED